jgi:hypothetical protein
MNLARRRGGRYALPVTRHLKPGPRRIPEER